LVFRILLVLAHGEQHGGSLAQALDESSGVAGLLPGHLYRTLDRMLRDGLIEERDRPASPQTSAAKRGTTPSRFLRHNPLGSQVSRAEKRRLEILIERYHAGWMTRSIG
jgi:hypothetical protein